jgi:macrolide-specific efflux system membrane fusion protein
MKKIKSVFEWIMKDKKRTMIAVFVLVLVIFGIYKLVFPKKSTTQYQTALVEKGTIISSVSASGQIISSNTLNISTQATGVVKEVFVKDGDKVYAGQKIASITLDPSGQQQANQAYSSYLSAKNALTNANISSYTLQASEFAANSKFINDAVARNLSTTDPTYIQENATWLAAEAQYNNQQNVVAQAQASLNNAWLNYSNASPTITALTSGTIDNITLTPGMVISGSSSTSTTTASSQRIAVIRSQGNPIATFNVSEIDVSKIKYGQKATITLDSLSDTTFTGKVVSVDRIGSVSSGVTNYPVIIAFDTGNDQVLPNMSATANIITATKDNILLVPTTAIQTQSGESVVRILEKNNQISTVTVTTGLSSDTQTEIVSGLSEGESVVTSTVFSGTTSSSGTSIFSSLGGARTGGTVGVNTGGR